MSTILLDLLQKSVGRTSRMLMRDHIELTHLQYSRDVEKFVFSSVFRVKQDMKRFFEEDREIKVLFADEIKDLEDSKNEEEVCIINPIEGIANFATALPFFAVVMFMRQKGRTSTSACLIDFPALQQTIYASTGEGAWITKSLPHLTTQKLKCPKKSQKGNKKEITICSDDAKDKEVFNAAKVLNFGCLTYEAFCVFSNSISACSSKKEVDVATREALTLIAREYGGQASSKNGKFEIYLPDVQTKQTLTKSYKI